MADFYQNYTHWSAVSTYRGGKQSFNLWCSQLQHFKLITKYVLKMINVVTHNVEYVHQTLEIMCMVLRVYIYLIQCVVFWFVCVAHAIKVNFKRLWYVYRAPVVAVRIGVWLTASRFVSMETIRKSDLRWDQQIAVVFMKLSNNTHIPIGITA